MSTTPAGWGHKFDSDAVCEDCGFDGAEWSHWRNYTHEGKADGDRKRPLCTRSGRPRDTYPETQPDDDDWPAEPRPSHNAARVTNLAQQRHKRLTLAAFEALEHADKRDARDQRAAVERAARNRL